MSGLAHAIPVRVYYEDTDAGGIVYHTSYLRFAERGRTELLRAIGLDHPTILREHGVLLVVRRCTVDFRAPARLDDLLLVTSTMSELGGASVVMRQVITRDDQPLVVVEVTVALLDANGRPKRMPTALRTRFSGPSSPA